MFAAIDILLQYGRTYLRNLVIPDEAPSSNNVRPHVNQHNIGATVESFDIQSVNTRARGVQSK